MEVWADLKKNSTSRKNAPKLAASMIVFTLSIFSTAKAIFFRVFNYIFDKLNAFLPFPGAPPALEDSGAESA